MPIASRDLSVADVHRFAGECFRPCAADSWGLEIETLVRRRHDPGDRPGPEEIDLAPLPRGSRVTVEPGGQVELSTPCCPTVDSALAVAADDERFLADRLAAAGLEAVPGAVDPRPPRRVLDLPRYRAMEAFFDAGGPWGRQMMCNTASLQVNLSTSDDPGLRWRVLHRVGPILVALFAGPPSPGLDGTVWASVRQRIWAGIDPGRTTAPALHGDPVRAWADYLLGADVMLVRTAEGAVGLGPGMPFGRWLGEGHQLGWPSMEDLRYHASTLFPPIRPRGWFELRMLDALSPELRAAAVALVAAATERTVAVELLARLPETGGWWLDAARNGLAHPGLREAAALLLATAAPAVADTARRSTLDQLAVSPGPFGWIASRPRRSRRRPGRPVASAVSTSAVPGRRVCALP